MRTGVTLHGGFFWRFLLMLAVILAALFLVDLTLGMAGYPIEPVRRGLAPSGDGREVRFLMLGDSSLEAIGAGMPKTFEGIVKRRMGQADSRVRFVHDDLVPSALDRHEPNAVLIFVHSRDFLSTSFDLDGEPVRDRWTAATGAVDAIVERCLKLGIPSAVVFMPAPLQYDPDYGGKWARGTALEKELEKWARDEKIPYLNLTPYFRAAVITDTPRPRFHELAAAVTLTWLSFSGFFGGAGL